MPLYMVYYSTHRPYLETELELVTKKPIRVLEKELPVIQHLPPCTGNTSSFEYWSGNVSKSSACNVRVFTRKNTRRCLANKTIYLHGTYRLSSNVQPINVQIVIKPPYSLACACGDAMNCALRQSLKFQKYRGYATYIPNIR